MQSFTIIVAVALVALAAGALANPVAHAVPLGPQEVAAAEPLEEVPLATGEERSPRLARATCDLLSMSTPWGSLNHSACAAHCLAMNKGFKGGSCRDGVCHCRR